MGISRLVPFRDRIAGAHDRRSAGAGTDAAVGRGARLRRDAAALSILVGWIAWRKPLSSPVHRSEQRRSPTAPDLLRPLANRGQSSRRERYLVLRPSPVTKPTRRPRQPALLSPPTPPSCLPHSKSLVPNAALPMPPCPGGGAGPNALPVSTLLPCCAKKSQNTPCSPKLRHSPLRCADDSGCRCLKYVETPPTGWKPVPRSHRNHLEGRALVLPFSVAQASSRDFFPKVSEKRMTGWKARPGFSVRSQC